jgi:hypothetical protein
MRREGRAQEFERLAVEARSRALRTSDTTAHSHWMGVASGLDLAAQQLRGDVAEYVAEAKRHAEHRCGWSLGLGCEVDHPTKKEEVRT